MGRFLTLLFEVEKLSEATESGETAAYAMAPLQFPSSVYPGTPRDSSVFEIDASFLLEHNLEHVGVSPVLVWLLVGRRSRLVPSELPSPEFSRHIYKNNAFVNRTIRKINQSISCHC